VLDIYYPCWGSLAPAGRTILHHRQHMSGEVIKGEMAGYVFENVETATYPVLISAADASYDASQSSLRANSVSP